MMFWILNRLRGQYSYFAKVNALAVALLIFAAVATNLTCKFILKRPSPLGNIHPFAFTAAAIIVIFAKVMFMV